MSDRPVFTVHVFEIELARLRGNLRTGNGHLSMTVAFVAIGVTGIGTYSPPTE